MVKSPTKHQSDDERLLYSRRQVAEMLGVNISYVQSLERSGRLQGLRLSRSPTSMVFFRRADVLALIEEASLD